MNTTVEVIVAFLLLSGAFFALIGSLGLVRLPDFFLRLHGPAKATTLGVGGILAGSAIFFSFHNESLSLHELLIVIFLFITAPISAHIVAKAALHMKLSCVTRTHGQAYLTSKPKVTSSSDQPRT